MYSIGLPAKSGVAGCVLGVIPNVMGISVWSPPLDQQGNSVRGVDFFTRLNQVYSFHVFDPHEQGGGASLSALVGAVLPRRCRAGAFR